MIIPYHDRWEYKIIYFRSKSAIFFKIDDLRTTGSCTYQSDHPFLSLVRVDLCPEGLLFRLEMLRLQGLLLRAAGTPALLTPDLFGSHPLGADESRPEPLDPVEEKAAG